MHGARTFKIGIFTVDKQCQQTIERNFYFTNNIHKKLFVTVGTFSEYFQYEGTYRDMPFAPGSLYSGS